jgi:hypothetical protein
MKAHQAVEASVYPPYPPGFLNEVSDSGFPSGYRYAETRFARIILAEAFPQLYRGLNAVLSELRFDVRDLMSDTDNNATIAARFDAMLGERSWDGQKSPIVADGMNRARGGVSINLYGANPDHHSYPGIAIELAWTFKSSLNRLLMTFANLHSEGELAVAVLLVAGPRLQTIEATSKQGPSTLTRSAGGWDEAVSLINGGAAGGCPMLIVGIEPERIEG